MILITGGAGFIGSSLADELLKAGQDIIVVDNLNDYYSPEIKENNIFWALTQKNYKFYKADIEDRDELENIFAKNKIDAVVHLAARAGVRPSIEHPLEYVKTNILGTVNILELMKKYGVKKMVIASSSSVYGNCMEQKFDEGLKISEPISPYAATKSACEQICYTYSHLYDMNIVCLRFFTVFGPRQRPDLAINKFVRLIKEGKEVPMFGDGTTKRDYTYIDDIVAGIKSAIEYDKSKYEIFNLGGGAPITLRDMIQTIEDVLGKKALIKEYPMQPGDVYQTISDCKKAEKLLNYHAKTSFKEGIKKFILWQQNILALNESI